MSKYVVAYSGGYDSTCLLNLYAKSSSENYPVKAISVSNHPNLGNGLMLGQYNAQINYLKFAKNNGYHIDHIRIEILCNGSIEIPKDGRSLQPFMWICNIAPYIDDGDKVVFGYIKKDCFWHLRSEFINVFNSLLKLKGICATISFPFEFKTKEEIFKMFKEYKIPKNCVFTCENSRNGKACGKCYKCKEIRDAKVI